MLKIKVADLVFLIENRFSFVERQCAEFVTNSDEVDMTVSVTEQEIETERGMSEFEHSDGYLESVCVYRKMCSALPSRGAMLLHAAVVEVDGEAYAFCAKSGTGKTTHARMWQRLLGDKVMFINGDKPLLRLHGDVVYAYGTPWCGKEKLFSNKKSPLKGVAFLERADQNSIEPIDKSQALRWIMHQILIPKDAEQVEATLSFLDRMLMNTDMWLLKCNISTEAAQICYNAMKGNTKNEN